MTLRHQGIRGRGGGVRDNIFTVESFCREYWRCATAEMASGFDDMVQDALVLKIGMGEAADTRDPWMSGVVCGPQSPLSRLRCHILSSSAGLG